MEELGIAAVVAPAIPIVVSLLKSARFPAAVNMGLAVAASFALATVAVLLTGEVDFTNGIQDPTIFLGSAAVAFGTSQIIYRLIIKGTAAGERVNAALSTTLPLGEPQVDPTGGGRSAEGRLPEIEVQDTPAASDAPPAANPPMAEEGAPGPPEEGGAISGSDICPTCGKGSRHPDHLKHTGAS